MIERRLLKDWDTKVRDHQGAVGKHEEWLTDGERNALTGQAQAEIRRYLALLAVAAIPSEKSESRKLLSLELDASLC